MKLSNTKVDKAGITLAKDSYTSEEEMFDAESIFDLYRGNHLQPLTEITLELQDWLSKFGENYYIAQGLKRKPQIIRKLNRFSVRLTQLQDIGGCRIIVQGNNTIDSLWEYLQDKVAHQKDLKLIRKIDYREKGRDDSGYRSLHLILERHGHKIELQIRSRIQHYWAESIERTSVIYGYHLKECEGHSDVLAYFKKLSDIFYEIECYREPSPIQKLDIDQYRRSAEEIIKSSDRNKILDGYVNENIIKKLVSVESARKAGFNNWIIIFDWNKGAFVSWDIVDRASEKAIQAYVENEKSFPARDGFEVVMIGSSDVATIRQTHSHYFGIDSYENILETLDDSVIGFTRRSDIDTDARQILFCLHRHRYWGKNTIREETLRNHYCKDAVTFDSSLELLVTRELILRASAKAPLSLNLKKKTEIENYL
jgi:ppGpp synthetase/RelA/SpoT-type nucleotidyltranferase